MGIPVPVPGSVTDWPCNKVVSFPANTGKDARTVMVEMEDVSAGQVAFCTIAA